VRYRSHTGDMDDLAGFLRTRRSRVAPSAVGIPTDSRRRVEGLRREEVAHLSGVSVDYYVRLEQGRATQPSEQVLDALARVLGLDETERGHLYRLARHSAAAARSRPAGACGRSCCAYSTWSPTRPP
jgi:hypothetical protein